MRHISYLKALLVFFIIPITVGVAIYLLFRPTKLTVFHWPEAIELLAQLFKVGKLMSIYELLFLLLTLCYIYITYWIVQVTRRAPFITIQELEFYDKTSEALGGWIIHVSNKGEAVAINLKVKIVMKEKKSDIDEQGKIWVDYDFFEADGSNYLAQTENGKMIFYKKDFFIMGDNVNTPVLVEYQDSSKWGIYLTLFSLLKLDTGEIVPKMELTRAWKGPFKSIRYKYFVRRKSKEWLDKIDKHPDSSDPEPDPDLIKSVNINTASFEDLQLIIHIGPERAQEIINLRPFSSLNQLEQVSGIGASRLQDIIDEGIAYVE